MLMETVFEKIQISETQGQVTTGTCLPENPSHLLIIGHGAGADMHHHFMEGLAEALAELNLASMRFNFPSMENRKGRPDIPAVAHKTIVQVVKYASKKYPALPLVLGGKSFGGRMASQVMALHHLPEVRALVFYGFPLHAAGKPGIERAQHLDNVKVPMLFLQGDRDTLARPDLLEPLLEKIPLAELRIYPGGDHSFKFPAKSGIREKEALEKLAHDTLQFVRRL
jgi:uncharacterized protein